GLPPLPSEDSPSRFRILGLSDSFGTAGGSENYNYQLVQLLPRGWDVQMVNLSIGDFQPSEEASLLERFGPAWHPKLILYGFYAGNDFILREGTELDYGGFSLLLREDSRSYLLPNWTSLQ